jgi:hypothetical protein
MRFAPQKYTLTHFTRKRNVNLEAPIRINNEEIAPSPVVRILGLQLDSKLRWKAHVKAVNQKMTTQMHVLSGIAASTWGAAMEKAQQIYLAVACPAIPHGATLWHRPGEKRQKAPAAKLQKHQNSGLRQVLGAFKATPIRQLETEAYVPPLDLCWDGRIARFQARLEQTGLARRVRDACTAIKMQLRLPVPAQDPERTAAGYPSYPTRLGAVHPPIHIGLPCILCRFHEPHCGIVIELYSYIVIQVKFYPFIYSMSLNSLSSCDVSVFPPLFFAFKALALAFTPGAGMMPCSICQFCDSTALVECLTRPDLWGSSSSLDDEISMGCA